MATIAAAFLVVWICIPPIYMLQFGFSGGVALPPLLYTGLFTIANTISALIMNVWLAFGLLKHPKWRTVVLLPSFIHASAWTLLAKRYLPYEVFILPWSHITILVSVLLISTGVATIVLEHALRHVNPDVLDAARVDGASVTFMRLRIVMPTVVYLGIMRILASLQLVTAPLLLTAGGPLDRTTPVLLAAYRSLDLFDVGLVNSYTLAVIIPGVAIYALVRTVR